jgi:LacI family transcriptional regulator
LARLTIHDVAREAGVSVATVDRVLNKRPGVRQQTIERVETTVSRLNYQPDRLAARLARAREYKLVFVLPTERTAFLKQLNVQLREIADRQESERVYIHAEETDVFVGKTLSQGGDAGLGPAVLAAASLCGNRQCRGRPDRGKFAGTVYR